jgi:hypothetical protein
MQEAFSFETLRTLFFDVTTFDGWKFTDVSEDAEASIFEVEDAGSIFLRNPQNAIF